MPELYATEDIPVEAKTVYLHFFIGGSDWYICEYDGKGLFFGFAILNGDLEMAEWGYISFGELVSIKVDGWLEIDRDLHWKRRPACEVEAICKAQGWPLPEKARKVQTVPV